MNWRAALQKMADERSHHVLISVIATSGSAPRDAGAKMVVTRAAVYDTVGGGQLEHMIVSQARDLLDAGHSGQVIQHYPLAAAAQQCCGGSVTVLFEAFVYQLNVAVFGAGYVGREVQGILSNLDARCTLYDTRADVSGFTDFQHEPDLIAALAGIDAVTHILIMTHDHNLDYQLVHACLVQQRVSIGLIGSATKWQRFRQRLQRDGLSAAQLARVRCPLGARDIKRKEPYAVALGIVTELLQMEPLVESRSLTWQQVKSALVSSDEAE